MKMEDLSCVNGGGLPEAALTFAGGVTTTVSAMSLLGGSSIGTIGVAACAACGPVGWAIIGIGVVGGVATGIVTAKELRRK